MSYDQLIKINQGLTKANLKSSILKKISDDLAYSRKLIPYRKGDKWGFSDENKNIIIECIYNIILGGWNKVYFKDGTEEVELNGKYGRIAKTGVLIIPIIYDKHFYTTYDLYQVSLNKKVGLINAEGRIIVDPIYDSFYEIENSDCIKAIKDGKQEIINKEGQIITKINYNYGKIFTKEDLELTRKKLIASMKEEFSGFKSFGKYGVKNAWNETIIDCIYDFYIGKFHEGLAAIEKNHEFPFKYGFINLLGEIVVDCLYDRVCDFHEGLALVSINEKWGVINKNGKTIVDCIYDNMGGFSEDLALVNLNNKYGYINKKGQIVIPCIYDDNGYNVDLELRGYSGKFIGGKVKVKLNGKDIIIDRKGELCTPQIYEPDFVNGFSKITSNGKIGYINMKGEQIIKCIYDSYPTYYNSDGNFKEGLIRVKRDGFFGYCNEDGNEIIKCIYEDARDFTDEIALVVYQGKKGFINKYGVQFWED